MMKNGASPGEPGARAMAGADGASVTVNAVSGVATFENLWITAPPMRSGMVKNE